MAVLHLCRNFANHIDTAVHCCCILVCNPRSHLGTSSSHWVCSPSFKCTVKVYFIYIDCKCIRYHILALTTDPGSQLAHQALIECAHPVLPAGDLLLRPTSLYLQYTDLYFVHICIRNVCSWLLLHLFCGTSSFISLYICNIVYIATVLSTDLFLFSNSYLRKCEYHRLLYWSSCWSLWFLLKRSSC